MKLDEALKRIGTLDINAMSIAKIKLDNLTKPIGSLGKFEDMIYKLSGIFKTSQFTLDKKAVIVMCADNGVFDEGVSSCPKEVTSTVTRNFFKGITGINVFCNLAKAEIFVVDIGVDDDLSSVKGLIHKKIRKGTWNCALGSSMTREEAILAIETGIDIVCDLKEKGYNFLDTGEMGIGNTTTSSAIAAILTDNPPAVVAGKGAGLTKEAFQNKIDVIQRAIDVNKPSKNDPIDVLAKVGGFDIAGLVGCFIGAAACRIPILIDGFISSVAALVASKIEPKVLDFLFPSHISAEPGSEIVMQELGQSPLLTLNMRLGEGTGAAVAFLLFDAALHAYYNMGTFDDALIEKYVPLD